MKREVALCDWCLAPSIALHTCLCCGKDLCATHAVELLVSLEFSVLVPNVHRPAEYETRTSVPQGRFYSCSDICAGLRHSDLYVQNPAFPESHKANGPLAMYAMALAPKTSAEIEAVLKSAFVAKALGEKP